MLLVIFLMLTLINISHAGGRQSNVVGAEDVTYQLLPSRLDQSVDKSVYGVRLGPRRTKREGVTPSGSPPVPPQSSATNSPKSATTLPMQNTIPFSPTRRVVSVTSTTQNGATHSLHSRPTTPGIQISTTSNIITSKSSEITNPAMQESTTPSLPSLDSSNATSIVSGENKTSSTTASTVMYTSNVTEVITELETVQMPTMTPQPNNGTTTTSGTTVNETTTSVSCAGCNKTSTASFNGSTTMTRGTSAEVTTHGTTLVSVVIEDGDHDYYTSKFYTATDGAEWYQDLTKNQQHVKRLQISDHHLHATNIDLTFTFPFYGHDIDSLYVATGGFLYLNSFFHQYISATQYIAPLMGNFHPGLYDNATVSYVSNETSITVEWTNVPVDHHEKEGGFTFQTTLRDDGLIIFAYKKIPLSVPDIVGGNNHKVTVGVSDGFFIDTTHFFTVKRTIYTYHTVELVDRGIADNTAFVLTPLKSCNMAETCDECLNISNTTNFDCRWCDSSSLPSQRCSSGLDRHRQDWLDANCHVVGIEDSCPKPTSPSPTTTKPKTTVGSGSSSKGKSPPATTVEDMSSDDSKVTKSMQVTNSKGKEPSKKPRPDGGSGPPVTDNPNSRPRSQTTEKPLIQPNRDNSSRKLSVAAIVVLVVLFIIVLVVIIVSGIIYVYRNPVYKQNVQIRELLIGANTQPADDLDAICETDC